MKFTFDKKPVLDLSIVVPTYNEKENIFVLLNKIFKEFKENKIDGEVIVVDDSSPDGTGKLLEQKKKSFKNLKIIHREGKLGLASAVLEGFKKSRGKIIGSMDADLSHSPDKINTLYSKIKIDDFDLAIGSRYISGGKTEGFGIYRKVLSKGAVFLARIYTSVKDPMTEYFFIKRGCIEGVEFYARGFRLLFEILIKSNCKKIEEVPINFINRKEGESKANFGEVAVYLYCLIKYLLPEEELEFH